MIKEKKSGIGTQQRNPNKKNSDNFVKFSYDFINSTSDSSEFIMSKVYYELFFRKKNTSSRKKN